MTTIISGIYGGYDKPKIPLPQSIPVNYVMLTDDPKLRAPGWNVLYDINRRRDIHPRLQAKVPKLMPWEFAPDDGPWIWVDGHIQIDSRMFAEQALSAVDTLGQWVHPDRDCLHAEAEFCRDFPKYNSERVGEQAEFYATAGHPHHWGLWATGVIVYKFELPHLAQDWWDEMNQWTYQDQVSQPFVLRKLQMRPEPLPWSLRDNPWMHIVAHRDGTS